MFEFISEPELFYLSSVTTTFLVLMFQIFTRISPLKIRNFGPSYVYENSIYYTSIF